MTIEWQAFSLSLKLAGATTMVLLPLAVVLARYLAWTRSVLKGGMEALVALPLVLPPTVLGYYLLVSFGPQGMPGSIYADVFGETLAFSFTGLLLASLVFNLPFAVQPAQRAFESIACEVRESAWCCGLNAWQTFWKIELPQAWMGVLSGAILTFAHTLGEFGVVLMVGGNIPGETRTISIAIFDRVTAFDDRSAAAMSAILLAFSAAAIASIYVLAHHRRNHEFQ
ncbi:MAG: Molybdenum transport system permease protein ModB [Gammaproteobacteria bacterium]|nr:Molybdenum transport system permease protein ModB [Gammaproteobacteria bacterium]